MLATIQEGRMQPRALTKFALAVALVVLMLPAALPAHAATASIGQYFASCNFFSVEVAVTGNINDGNNVDRVRYLVTDGNGKKLYQEDATRSIGVTGGSAVMNLGYDADGVADGPPGKNPVTFAALELDANNNIGT